MALASRLASADNAVPSLLGSDNCLSKKNQKNPELVPACVPTLHVLVESSYISDVFVLASAPLHTQDTEIGLGALV